MNDPINRPAHYTACSVECIEVTRLLPFAIGNAVKYVWRAGLKDQTEQELGKAEWYIKDHFNHSRQVDKADLTAALMLLRQALFDMSRPRFNLLWSLVLLADDKDRMNEVLSNLTAFRNELRS